MALVTGSTQDLMGFNLAGVAFELWFYPESKGHGLQSPTLGERWLFPGRAGKAAFVAGSTRDWEINLNPTGGLRPLSWYRPKIVYLDSAGNFTREEWVPVKLFVPPAGGSFAELVNVDGSPGNGGNPTYVWWAATAPPDPQPGDIWVNTVTGDVKEY